VGVLNYKDIYFEMKQLIRHILREHTREIILEMPKKLTQDEFIIRAKEANKNKYTYEKTNYLGTSQKVIVTCRKHGDFEITPAQHMRGVGCVECYREKYKGNNESFNQKVINLYGDKFDLSQVDYKTNVTPVKIGCPIHGKFKITPHNFLILKSDCPKCKDEKLKLQRKIDFINRAEKKHKGKYDYSDVEWKDIKSKVKIICPEHGPFHQTPDSHLRGAECGICGDIKQGLNQRTPKKDFLKMAKEIHGNFYDYSKMDYQGFSKKTKIICPEHGEFFQEPRLHINQKHGCPKCAGNVKRTTETFIDAAIKVHPNKYDYSQVQYQSNHKPVTIICPEHGNFTQAPSSHLGGAGCPECAIEKNADLYRLPLETFIEKSNEFHNGKYDYSKVEYVNGATPVEIICSKHGSFHQIPRNHMVGVGCPYCNESKGEKYLDNLFKSIGLKFIRQHKFIDCTNTLKGRKCRKLPFDFYLPEKNVLIEFDGKQHFEPVSRFGGKEGFERTKFTDGLKNKYATENGIKLIRIPYTMKKEEIEPYILKELGIK
jgi:very-short-patch-repair endonuclease